MQNKTISEETALQARGLFALGRMHYKKVRDVERALSELLGYEDETYCECLSDELYDETTGSFDKGLAKEGFVVTKPTPKKKRR